MMDWPTDGFKQLYKRYQADSKDAWLNDELEPKDCLLQACGIDLFYGRYSISKKMWNELLALPDQAGLKSAIQKLFQAEVVNTSENSAATHTQSRQDYLISSQSWKNFHRWAGALHAGRTPESGIEIKSVIHLGTGGSRLGPELLIDALGTDTEKPFQPYFVSSHDEKSIARVLKQCDPVSTLVLVVSKGFSTLETKINGSIARNWLRESLSREAAEKRLIAITADKKTAVEWGILPGNCLLLPQSVGGRYSISSPVSLIAAAYLGESVFSRFMAAMVEMDQHFFSAAWSESMPVVFALLSIWSVNFLSIPSRAVLPYSSLLSAFVPYLQQLFMESLGKNKTNAGTDVQWSTGSIIWGGIGSESQHSFHQLIMQGTHRHQVEFIAPKDHPSSWQNALAQAQVMQRGNGLMGNAAIAGGHPSISLFVPTIDAHALGSLIALYEHRCFVQSVLWGINCFDQPGVETGKKLSQAFSSDSSMELDASTRQLHALVQGEPS